MDLCEGPLNVFFFFSIFKFFILRKPLESFTKVFKENFNILFYQIIVGFYVCCGFVFFVFKICVPPLLWVSIYLLGFLGVVFKDLKFYFVHLSLLLDLKII
jgi:hypothetical protein